MIIFAALNSLVSTNSASTNTVQTVTSNRDRMLDLAERFGPKLLAALLVLTAGIFIARWVGKLVEKALGKRDMEPPLRMLLVRFIKLLVILFTVIIAVQNLGVEVLPLVAGLGVAGVGVGLAMQGVLSNLVAGLTIIFVKKFRVGEYIELNDVHGQVDVIELFSTVLLHPDRSRVIIPNRKIVGEIIHNYGMIRQLDITVGVAYDTDMNRALAVVNEILTRNERVLKDPRPVVAATNLADSAVEISIKPWTSVADFGSARGEITKAILEEFRRADIEIPFPQREIRVLPGSELKSSPAA